MYNSIPHKFFLREKSSVYTMRPKVAVDKVDIRGSLKNKRALFGPNNCSTDVHKERDREKNGRLRDQKKNRS